MKTRLAEKLVNKSLNVTDICFIQESVFNEDHTVLYFKETNDYIKLDSHYSDVIDDMEILAKKEK